MDFTSYQHLKNTEKFGYIDKILALGTDDELLYLIINIFIKRNIILVILHRIISAVYIAPISIFSYFIYIMCIIIIVYDHYEKKPISYFFFLFLYFVFFDPVFLIVTVYIYIYLLPFLIVFILKKK